MYELDSPHTTPIRQSSSPRVTAEMATTATTTTSTATALTPSPEEHYEETTEMERFSPPPMEDVEEQVQTPVVASETQTVGGITSMPRSIPHGRPAIHHIHPSLALLHHARPHGGLSLMPEPIIIDPYHPLLRAPLQRHIPGSYYSPYLGAPYC